MQKILVVDDEKLARSDIIYKIGKSGLHFEWILEASNVEEALEIIQKNKPDILITDIVMDERNGINLIDNAKIVHPKLVSIIISGYPDFNFAQEAISLHVIEYLIKPVRQAQLTAALTKAALHVLQKNKTASISVRNDLLTNRLTDYHKQEEIYTFLNGFRTDAVPEVETLFPEKPEFYQILAIRLTLGKDHQGRASNIKKDYDLLRYGVRNIITETGKEYVYSFDNYADCRQILAVTASSCANEDCAKSELSKMAARIQMVVENSLATHLYIGLSSVYRKLSAMQMEEAKQSLDLRICMRGTNCSRVFCFSDYVDKAQGALNEADLQLYQHFLDQGELSHALEVVHKIFDDISGKPVLHLRMIYVELICVLARSCFKKGVSIFTFLGTECINGTVIEKFSTMDELVAHLCSIVSAALNQWVGGHEDTAVILQKVKSYIEEHFFEKDLSTTLLAELFCISIGYLCASYKKAYGITISKSIVALRIEYAARLLVDTDLPIHAVSDNCGFNNPSYFMRVFKSHYNTTPNKYRSS